MIGYTDADQRKRLVPRSAQRPSGNTSVCRFLVQETRLYVNHAKMDIIVFTSNTIEQVYLPPARRTEAKIKVVLESSSSYGKVHGLSLATEKGLEQNLWSQVDTMKWINDSVLKSGNTFAVRVW